MSNERSYIKYQDKQDILPAYQWVKADITLKENIKLVNE